MNLTKAGVLVESPVYVHVCLVHVCGDMFGVVTQVHGRHVDLVLLFSSGEQLAPHAADIVFLYTTD